MVTRRKFLLAGGAAATVPLIAVACGSDKHRATYDETAVATWDRPDRAGSSVAALQRELVRYATLAPSSHNTQCWKFARERGGITILPDFSRRLPVVDPDDHHVFVSLGCAAENLIQAAIAHGLAGEAAVADVDGGSIGIALTPTAAVASPLFQSIPHRQSTRRAFDGTPLSGEELRLLERAGTGAGARVLLLTGRPVIEAVLEYVVAGNTAQMGDPAFVRELKQWIRFSEAEAVDKADGLFSRASGNQAVPRWFGSLVFPVVFKVATENDKYATLVRSSAGIAVFVSDANDKPHWVETGRCYERFALQATALGIRNSFVNQAVESPAPRSQLANYLGLHHLRPDLVVRFGRGPTMPRSLRRPVDAVLI